MPIVRSVLFICVFNATRSIMAEALLNHLGGGRFRAFSTGESSFGPVHPLTLECLAAHGISTTGLHSKTWERYFGLGAPGIDLIITVCRNSQEEMSRHSRRWPFPIKAHWDTADPIVMGDSEEQTRRALDDTFGLLKRRIKALVQLPLDGLERTAQWEAIMAIGQIYCGDALPEHHVPPRGFDRPTTARR
jgi:arsenate reductase